MSREFSDVELIIHINESLGESSREELTSALVEKEGVRTAEFCPLRYHLMLVSYDRGQASSQEILHHVSNQSVHAQLVGPV